MSHFLNAAFGRNGRLLRSFEERLGIAVLVFALLFASAQAVMAHEFKVGDLEIGHPWSRATPAGAKVAGGYFTVTNHGSAPDRLVSISSDIAAKAEVHEMAVKDGVMTMRKVDGGLEVPAKGKAELAPGGYHLMFIGLNRQPKQGEKFAATLTFLSCANAPRGRSVAASPRAPTPSTSRREKSPSKFLFPFFIRKTPSVETARPPLCLVLIAARKLWNRPSILSTWSNPPPAAALALHRRLN